jgi:hypothetical protein
LHGAQLPLCLRDRVLARARVAARALSIIITSHNMTPRFIIFRRRAGIHVTVRALTLVEEFACAPVGVVAVHRQRGRLEPLVARRLRRGGRRVVVVEGRRSALLG